jgi:WD40 repeat protein
VYGIEFTSDGESMLTVGGDGAVRRTKFNARHEKFRELRWLSGKSECAAIPDSNMVITTNPLAVHDRLSGSLIRTLSTDPYQTLAVSSDGTLVAAGSPSQIGAWNITTGERKLRVDQQRRSVGHLDFSPDSLLLAVSSHDGTTSRVDVVEIATGKSTRYTVPDHSASAAYFCADDGLIVMYSTPYQFTYRTIPDQHGHWQIRQTDTRIHNATPSPHRALLLASVRTRNLWMIECATGAIRYEVSDDNNPATFAFLGDGRNFVVGSSPGGQLCLWHTATGRRLFEIANIESGIDSIQPLDSGFLVSTRRVKDGRTELVWCEF